MRIKRTPEDFQVEERILFPGERGAYAYYRVEKRAVPTLVVRDMLAARLKVTPSALVFPALKDATAVAVQYASVRMRGAERIDGKGFTAQRVQWGPRALRPRDLEGNRFTIIARDLSEQEAAALAGVMAKIELDGLPNYFDDQRFGSLADEGFIGKAILDRDAEKALRLYLAEPMLGDPAVTREFKALVKSHWGQWGYLLHQAPRPSNYRSVITYLKDHPHDYDKAVNLIQDRLLSIYLAAYQSWIWNHILSRYLEHATATPSEIDIAGSRHVLPEADTVSETLKKQEIDLPRLTARYEDKVGEAAKVVFERESLTLRDFKARILRRVYLSKGERLVWFAPEAVEVAAPFEDEHNPDRWAVPVSFTLRPGSYATLVMKAAAGRIGANLRAR
jgi:tRNA pseudouridine13 synthase